VTDDTLASYLPLYTETYSLFAPAGNLQLLRTAESADRYLLDRAILASSSPAEWSREIRLFAGAGETNRLDQRNWINLWCRHYRLDVWFGLWCEGEQGMTAFKGPAYWQTLTRQSQFDRQNLTDRLQTYQVTYLVWPKTRLAELALSHLLFKPLWQDDHYIVYELLPKT
jgi:hypothetical protein